MEEPGNYGARVVFQNHGMRIVPVPVEQDGVSTKSLHFSRAQAIYVTPSRQFPLGGYYVGSKKDETVGMGKNKTTLLLLRMILTAIIAIIRGRFRLSTA